MTDGAKEDRRWRLKRRRRDPGTDIREGGCAVLLISVAVTASERRVLAWIFLSAVGRFSKHVAHA